MQGYKSDYEKYVLISEHSRFATGDYPSFLRMKEIMSVLNQMAGKQSNTYTYNGESYVSSLTNPEIQQIQSAFEFGTYNNSIEKLKYIFIDIGDRIF